MNLKAFETARGRMSGILHNVPLENSETFSVISGGEIFLKCENHQKTGSFKVRGAFNKISALLESGSLTDVVACSAGNHAQGVAYAAKKLGISSTIVMPRNAPLAKIAATEGYGASVVLHGAVYDDTYEKAVGIAESSNAAFIPAFNDDEIIAGQGTISLEILSELPAVDIILAPCGGGGLLAGIAACCKQINPRIKIIGVQAEGADAAVRSFKSKEYTQTESAQTISDGIAVRAPGARTVELINKYADDMVTVSDTETAEAILLLMERCKQVVEPAGAVSVAAILNKRVNVAGKRAVCILSGGNIDVSFIERIVERGLSKRGRRLQFRTTLMDAPGALANFCSVLSEQGSNILTLHHDRLGKDLGINQTEVLASLEVSGSKHGAAVIEALRAAGYVIQ